MSRVSAAPAVLTAAGAEGGTSASETVVARAGSVSGNLLSRGGCGSDRSLGAGGWLGAGCSRLRSAHSSSRADDTVPTAVTETSLAASAAVIAGASTVSGLRAAVTECAAQASVAIGATACSISGDLLSSSGSWGRGSLGSAGSGGSGTASCAVPVGLRVTEALSDGYGGVTKLLNLLEHVLSQVVGGLDVNVVLNVEPRSTACGSSATGSDVTQEPILRILDQSRAILLVIIRVDVEVDHVAAFN